MKGGRGASFSFRNSVHLFATAPSTVTVSVTTEGWLRHPTWSLKYLLTPGRDVAAIVVEEVFPLLDGVHLNDGSVGIGGEAHLGHGDPEGLHGAPDVYLDLFGGGWGVACGAMYVSNKPLLGRTQNKEK